MRIKRHAEHTWHELVLLVLLSVLVGGAANLLRPQGLPFVTDWEATRTKALIKDTPSVNVQEALELWSKKEVIFLDARDSVSFSEGHIPGALNQPLDDVKSDSTMLARVALALPKDKLIVVYCSDVGCKMSAIMANMLKGEGLNTTIFPAGLEGWFEAGGEVEISK